MRASGARLVEVGTTNRTRAADFKAALEDTTAAILQVHPSNYRVVGFTAAATTSQLAQLAAKAGVPLVFDVGSGLLDAERGFPGEEPSVRQALADGADLVTFSGDKLLGGPQAGCIVGRADLIAKLRKHPLARAMRIDKLQAAGLEATLGPLRDRRARRDPRAPDDPREPRHPVEARALPVGEDRWRSGRRARRALRVGGRRRVAPRSVPVLLGCAGALPRPRIVRRPAPHRLPVGVLPRAGRPRPARRADRSPMGRSRSSPARSSTPWKATTSTTRTDP